MDQQNARQRDRDAMKRQLALVRQQAKRYEVREEVSTRDEKPSGLFRIARIATSGTDRMTGIGEHLVLPKPSTEAPRDLRWACSICGIIEPLFIPANGGRWIQRSCTCQIAERQATRDLAEKQIWAKEQRSLCFGGWLGRQWASESIVQEMSRKRFDNYARERFPEAFEFAKEFTRSPRGNLVFTGDYGTGKTHLASAIANALLEQGQLCRFASAPQLYESYVETRKPFDQTIHIQLQERLYGCTVLILDDVDKSEPTPDMHKFYYTLFDERYKARKSTIITTNHYDEMEHYIGKAALSRLSRALRVVEMVGDDYRLEESFDW